jgi:hypothetical protein
MTFKLAFAYGLVVGCGLTTLYFVLAADWLALIVSAWLERFLRRLYRR